MKKYKRHTDEEKVKIVLEVLREEATINEIASKYEVHPKSVIDWKKTFLSNAAYAMNPNKSLKEQKEHLKHKDKKIDELHRQLGDITAQLNWAKKKSREAGLPYEAPHGQY
jgi:putative transposase